MLLVSYRPTTKRLNIVVFAVCAVFFLVAFRLFTLQVLSYEKYKNISLNQRENYFKKSSPKRGDIFLNKKNGDMVPIASTKNGFLIYLNPSVLENPEEAYSKLSSVLSIDKEVFLKLSQKTDDPFEILKRKLSEEEVQKVLVLGIKGVGVARDEWRFYPFGAFLSHVLGFSSVISDIPEGKYGVEKFYNSFLSDQDRQDADNFKLMSYFVKGSKDGNDLFLTVEPNVQAFVENELDFLRDKWKAESGGILVLDPKTGKIVSMAAFPDFDPNKYFEEKKLNVFLNPFVENIFEMGSVFKPLTMAIAIDRGNITPETTYIDKGFVEVGGVRLKNFDEKPRGKRSMTEVLEESLNTGAVFAMQSAGKKVFKDYLEKFGFYEKTNIDLPGEVKSNLSNLNSGRDVEFATASFGQGIAVSPIAMARALLVLANGGKLINPSVSVSVEHEEPKQVIKEETAFLVSKMLVDVVDHTLAGGKAKMENYSIAAKTGTAQIPDPKTRKYSDEFLHSFFGYFPAYNSKFLIFMFLERPYGAKYSSQTLTDSFTNMTKFLINYYNISPDR